MRALVSATTSEADWASYLLSRLAGERVVATLSALIEDPRSPEDGRARASSLLADLSAPETRSVASLPFGPELALVGSVSEFLRCLDGASDVKMAVDMVTRAVPEDELVAFAKELARHGGPTALPVLDGLLDERNAAPGLLADDGGNAFTTDAITKLRDELAGNLIPASDAGATAPSACERHVRPSGAVAKAPRQEISRRALSRSRILDLVERGDYRRARPHLEAACARGPHDHEALSYLGVCLLHLGEPNRALDRFESLATLDPAEALHHWNVAAAAMASERVCRSYFALVRYLERPDASDGARDRRREARRFVRTYEELIKTVHPGASLAHVLEGEQLFLTALADLEAGHAEVAADGFRRVLALLPAHHPSWGNLGTAELALGHSDEAARCLRRALSLKPDYAVARENLQIIETRH